VLTEHAEQASWPEDRMTATKPLAAAVLGGALAVGLALPASAQTKLPDDVKRTCTVDDSTFADWFKAGTVSKNGPVKPADSVNFKSAFAPSDKATNCDFYKWGAQMFLWLTSPEKSGYVLDGPKIFTVTPPKDSGARHFVRNEHGAAIEIAHRAEKRDDIGEIGQAGFTHGVLMSQDHSLVYYGIHTNEPYAFFLTGQKRGQFPKQSTFPHTEGGLKKVKDYVANAYPNTKLSAPGTLMMELKTSWVEAHTVDDPEDYVTIKARVPSFDHVDSKTWTKSGSRTARLALVGIHIVGTVENHPEFVWSTFEHIDNVPNAEYYYTNTDGNKVKHPYSADGNYVFAETGTKIGSANAECMLRKKGQRIVAQDACNKTIQPSNTVRIHAWGSKDLKGNPVDPVVNTTRVLSLNNNIRKQLKAGDVRRNYIQVGGIWTSPANTKGKDAPIPRTNAFNKKDLRGSLSLSNATMETYQQGTRCFTCHHQRKSAKNSFESRLSHIFQGIAPLPSANSEGGQ
jgi:hypothetical protein